MSGSSQVPGAPSYPSLSVVTGAAAPRRSVPPSPSNSTSSAPAMTSAHDWVRPGSSYRSLSPPNLRRGDASPGAHSDGGYGPPRGYGTLVPAKKRASATASDAATEAA
ncbi:unnamed protein product, partial [Chrysoparadoxa australica]